MNDLLTVLRQYVDGLTLVEQSKPLLDQLVQQLPAYRRLLTEAEKLETPLATPAKPTRGQASRPTVDKATYRGCVRELLAANGDVMPADDLQELAAERVVSLGYCRKFLGKWFGEMLGDDLIELPGGKVGVCDPLESATDQAFIDGAADVR